MVLRIVETPSCNRKNAKVRGHSGTGVLNILPMVEVPSYTRENTNNRLYTVSNIEDVPTNHAIGLRTLKTT
tara:strand:+ start:416 stop:628 length:213 start_codon:yes stop_codon:yes gene_type:complete